MSIQNPHEAEFLERLSAEPKVQVDYARVLDLYQRIFPEARDDPRLRAHLLEVLRRAEEAGRLALPKGKGAWIPGSPSVPSWVRRIRPKRAPDDPDTTVWVPAMAFAADIRDRRRRRSAAAINAYLRTRSESRTPVPSRERSLEIFGDEKRLDAMADPRGRLFDGQLSLADLDCMRIPLPLPYELPERPAPDRPVLVLENHHSYWSFSTWNRQARRYAAVAYGSGNAFATSAEHLDAIVERSSAAGLRYLGDLDLKGIEIPATANRRRVTRGLQRIEPECHWYRWLLRHGRRCPCATPDISRDSETRAAEWLGEELWTEMQQLFLSGQRIPQEALGLQALRSTKRSGSRRNGTGPAYRVGPRYPIE